MSEANSMDCRVGQFVPSDSMQALWDKMGCIADDEVNMRLLSAYIETEVTAEREKCAKLRAAARAFYNATVAAPGVRISSHSEALRDAADSAGKELRALLVLTEQPNTN